MEKIDLEKLIEISEEICDIKHNITEEIFDVLTELEIKVEGIIRKIKEEENND